jgi:hypothetical protein
MDIEEKRVVSALKNVSVAIVSNDSPSTSDESLTTVLSALSGTAPPDLFVQEELIVMMLAIEKRAT